MYSKENKCPAEKLSDAAHVGLGMALGIVRGGIYDRRFMKTIVLATRDVAPKDRPHAITQLKTLAAQGIRELADLGLVEMGTRDGVGTRVPVVVHDDWIEGGLLVMSDHV